MGDSVSFDATAAAAIYTVENTSSWAKNFLLAGAQTAANITLLEKQRTQYEDISQDRIRIINHAVSNYHTRLQSVIRSMKEAYPDNPQAEAYIPVNPCDEQEDQIECNLGTTTRANEWATLVSRYQAQSDFTRMVVLDPRWYVNIDMYSITLGDLLRGEFPVGDLMEVMTGSAEASLATGRVGGSQRMGRRNVATARLRLQAAGRAELRRQAALMGSVSPIKRMASPDEMMQTPQQRIALALTQAQLIQNSMQNWFNRNAQKPPYRLARLNLKMEKAVNVLQMQVSRANLTNTFVPNYAAILAPQINALTSTVPTNIPRPFNPSTAGTDPQVGGGYEEQNASNPFTNYASAGCGLDGAPNIAGRPGSRY
jgi:hypothetical protein